LRIGWVSASPTAKTGYGTQTYEVCSRLLKEHFVVCIGQVGEPIVWGGRQEVETPNGKLKVVSLADPISVRDLINGAYVPEFNLDVLLGFMDAFGLEYLNDCNRPAVFWIPIDGPFTDKWRNLVRNGYRVLAYSQYGHRELAKWLPPSRIGYIPHMIDVKVFRPFTEEDRALARLELEEKHGIPRDVFLGVHVGANIGPRKNLPLLMWAWKRFVERHLDDRPQLYIYTNAYGYPRGYDLISWRIMLDMEKNIHFPFENPIIKPVSPEELAKLYGAADLYVSLSCAEGFGLPLLEAEACGRPCLVPRNSAQVELVEGCGWLCGNIPEDAYYTVPEYVPMLTKYPAPDVNDFLRNLEEAYKDGDLRELFARKARRRALGYTPERVMPLWFRFFRELEEELDVFNQLQRDLR